MIQIEDILKEVEHEGQRYVEIGFACEHCGQVYKKGTLDIAVFLYGVFFLMGKDTGFIGLNCPQCLNTIALKGDMKQVMMVCYIAFRQIWTPSNHSENRLAYFSSVNYAPENIKGLGAFSIHTCRFSIDKNDVGVNHGQVEHQIMESPELETDYLCSYLADPQIPMGERCSVSWFKEDEIDVLVNFENKRGRNVFPRYFHKIDLLETVERFCWEHYLEDEYLDYIGNDIQDVYGDLENMAVKNGIELETLLAANPTVNPDLTAFIKENRIKGEDWGVGSDFMKILEADPDPFPVLSPETDPFRWLWKIQHPFKDRTVPDVIGDEVSRFKDGATGKNHAEMVSDVRAGFHRQTVQEFLAGNYIDFISDYIDCARKTTFSYADLWGLKERYLGRLHRHLRKGSPARKTARDLRTDKVHTVPVLPDEGSRATGEKPASLRKKNNNDGLGKVLRTSEVARYLGVDVKTVRKYHTELGGVRLGRRYVFFEKEITNAIQSRAKMEGPSQERWTQERENVQHEKGGDRLGSENAEDARRRLVREDRHGLFG